ncbi:MAG: hypothetical protein J0I20_27405 [Chloroflexi bacterium]|nr:hypothetical protein [Chloroflexota bacterium]OJV98317.1 MAG: hypothetical protein BGO39_16185 [Chloroflexi bacterium 54-19]
MTNLPAVVRWDLNGEDAEKLQNFYGKLFDWDFKDSNHPNKYRYIEAESGSGGIGGGIGELQKTDDPQNEVTRAQQHSGLLFYVRVERLEPYLERVERLGGKVVWGPLKIHEGLELAQVMDPEGNRVGLMQN